MADSYHIIDGKVIPYSGGRKCNDTDAWRDATPLELQLQEQLAEYEHASAAQAAEIEALRAEVERLREIVRPKREEECLTLDHWRMRAYYLEENWSRCSRACAIEQDKRELAEARAERLAEALRELVAVFSESGMHDDEVSDKAREVLALTPHKPLFGHPSGKRGGTHWITFMKPAQQQG